MTDTDTAAPAELPRVKIFDTTLRDGEQSPGASMTLDEKLQIAALLDDMGVDIIEAGFPIASEGDFEAVSAIARATRSAVVAGLARASKGDIDRAWAALEGARRPRIHTFIGTSPIHREHQLAMSKEQVLEKIAETVAHARRLADDVQWSPMDATRTEFDFLVESVRIAVEAGASTINIPDTVGYTAPRESAELIRRLREAIPELAGCTVSTHCHNDLGMATANALAAVEAGARQIECTVNGLGERAGNTALEEVVMALRVRADILPFATGIETRRLMAASRMVATAAGFPVQYNKAIVGKNAFAHESGIHQDGMLKNAQTFEIMRPEDVGLSQTNLVMGKHSGRHAFRTKLSELGIDLGENALNDAFVRFKALADSKKEVYDDDLLAIVEQAAAEAGSERVKLKFLRAISGTEAPKSADVTLEIDGRELRATAHGDGPVDAAFAAISALVAHEAVLELYQIKAVTEGTDAQAHVQVRLREHGRFASAQASDTDTVVASARAYVQCLNKLILRREKSAAITATG
ncbi:MAG: 2-isopropylmalate synthase [Paracoccaceae bacterium]